MPNDIAALRGGVSLELRARSAQLSEQRRGGAEKTTIAFDATLPLGFGISDLTEGRHGVSFVKHGSQAQTLGLEVGDCVVAIDGSDLDEIHGMSAMAEILRTAVNAVLQRNDVSLRVTIERGLHVDAAAKEDESLPFPRAVKRGRRVSIDAGVETQSEKKKLVVKIEEQGSLGLEFGVDCNSGRIVLVALRKTGIIAQTAPGVLRYLDRLDAIADMSEPPEIMKDFRKSAAESEEFKRAHSTATEDEQNKRAHTLMGEVLITVMETDRPFTLIFHRPIFGKRRAKREDNRLVNTPEKGKARAAVGVKPSTPPSNGRGPAATTMQDEVAAMQSSMASLDLVDVEEFLFPHDATRVAHDHFVDTMSTLFEDDEHRKALSFFFGALAAISSTRNDGAEQQNEDVPTASVEVATAAMSTMCTASHNDVTDAVFRNFARKGENTLAKSEVSRFLHIVIDMTLRLRDTDEVPYDTTRAVRLAGATARVMFDAIDRDHDGSVDRDEFETWLGKALGAKKPAPPDDNTTPAGTASHVEVEAMKHALERLNLMVAITTMFPRRSDLQRTDDVSHRRFVEQMQEFLGEDESHQRALSFLFSAMMIGARSTPRGDGGLKTAPDRASIEVVTASLSTMCTTDHRDVVEAVFSVFDAEKSGALSQDEVHRFLRVVFVITLRLRESDVPFDAAHRANDAGKLASVVARQMFNAIDRDHDGKVERGEFEVWLGTMLADDEGGPPQVTSKNRGAEGPPQRRRRASLLDLEATVLKQRDATPVQPPRFPPAPPPNPPTGRRSVALGHYENMGPTATNQLKLPPLKPDERRSFALGMHGSPSRATANDSLSLMDTVDETVFHDETLAEAIASAALWHSRTRAAKVNADTYALALHTASSADTVVAPTVRKDAVITNANTPHHRQQTKLFARKRRAPRRDSTVHTKDLHEHSIEGPLLKKGARGYQRRYFLTSSHYLLYRSNVASSTIAGGLDLATQETTITLSADSKTLTVVGLDAEEHRDGAVRPLRVLHLRATKKNTHPKAIQPKSLQQWELTLKHAVRTMSRADALARNAALASAVSSTASWHKRTCSAKARADSFHSAMQSRLRDNLIFTADIYNADVVNSSRLSTLGEAPPPGRWWSDHAQTPAVEAGAAIPLPPGALNHVPRAVQPVEVRNELHRRDIVREEVVEYNTVRPRNASRRKKTVLFARKKRLARRSSVGQIVARSMELHEHSIQGTLLKKGAHGFQKRFFFTSGHYLLYRANKSATEIAGGVDLAGDDTHISISVDGNTLSVIGLDAEVHRDGDARPLRFLQLRSPKLSRGLPTPLEWHAALQCAALSLRGGSPLSEKRRRSSVEDGILSLSETAEGNDPWEEHDVGTIDNVHSVSGALSLDEMEEGKNLASVDRNPSGKEDVDSIDELLLLDSDDEWTTQQKEYEDVGENTQSSSIVERVENQDELLFQNEMHELQQREAAVHNLSTMSEASFATLVAEADTAGADAQSSASYLQPLGLCQYTEVFDGEGYELAHFLEGHVASELVADLGMTPVHAALLVGHLAELEQMEEERLQAIISSSSGATQHRSSWIGATTRVQQRHRGLSIDVELSNAPSPHAPPPTLVDDVAAALVSQHPRLPRDVFQGGYRAPPPTLLGDSIALSSQHSLLPGDVFQRGYLQRGAAPRAPPPTLEGNGIAFSSQHPRVPRDALSAYAVEAEDVGVLGVASAGSLPYSEAQQFERAAEDAGSYVIVAEQLERTIQDAATLRWEKDVLEEKMRRETAALEENMRREKAALEEKIKEQGETIADAEEDATQVEQVWVDALAEAMEEGKKVADGLTRQYDLKSATAEECRRLELDILTEEKRRLIALREVERVATIEAGERHTQELEQLVQQRVSLETMVQQIQTNMSKLHVGTHAAHAAELAEMKTLLQDAERAHADEATEALKAIAASATATTKFESALAENDARHKEHVSRYEAHATSLTSQLKAEHAVAVKELSYAMAAEREKVHQHQAKFEALNAKLEAAEGVQMAQDSVVETCVWKEKYSVALGRFYYKNLITKEKVLTRPPSHTILHCSSPNKSIVRKGQELMLAMLEERVEEPREVISWTQTPREAAEAALASARAVVAASQVYASLTSPDRSAHATHQRYRKDYLPGSSSFRSGPGSPLVSPSARFASPLKQQRSQFKQSELDELLSPTAAQSPPSFMSLTTPSDRLGEAEATMAMVREEQGLSPSNYLTRSYQTDAEVLRTLRRSASPTYDSSPSPTKPPRTDLILGLSRSAAVRRPDASLSPPRTLPRAIHSPDHSETTSSAAKQRDAHSPEVQVSPTGKITLNGIPIRDALASKGFTKQMCTEWNELHIDRHGTVKMKVTPPNSFKTNSLAASQDAATSSSNIDREIKLSNSIAAAAEKSKRNTEQPSPPTPKPASEPRQPTSETRTRTPSTPTKAHPRNLPARGFSPHSPYSPAEYTPKIYESPTVTTAVGGKFRNSNERLRASGGILPNIQASAHDDSLREKRRVLKMGEFSPLKKNVDRSLLGLSGGRFY